MEVNNLKRLVFEALWQALPEKPRRRIAEFRDDPATAAAQILCEDKDMARFANTDDGSVQVHTGFELALKLCAIALDNPLELDMDGARGAIEEADDYLDGWRKMRDNESKHLEVAGKVR